jgi:hypothetical protein
MWWPLSKQNGGHRTVWRQLPLLWLGSVGALTPMLDPEDAQRVGMDTSGGVTRPPLACFPRRPPACSECPHNG